MDSSLVVALALVGACLVITIVAMIRFPTSTFFRFWAAFGPIFGGLIGTIGAYYLQANEVSKAKDTTASLVQTIQEMKTSQDQVGKELDSLEKKFTGPAVVGKPELAGAAANLQAIRQHYIIQQARLNSAVTKIPRELMKPPGTPKP
jgi:hypothetical protein